MKKQHFKQMVPAETLENVNKSPGISCRAGYEIGIPNNTTLLLQIYPEVYPFPCLSRTLGLHLWEQLMKKLRNWQL